MKSKLKTVIINVFLASIVLAVSLVGFLSGGTAAVSAEGENLFYGGEKSGNCVSLTFNVYEGTDVVYDILSVLDEYGAQATFFIGGSWADDNVDCVREIYRRGHEIGSHGYFHKDHSRLSYAGNLEEIRPSVKLLEMICMNKVGLFAPPSGAFNDNTLLACAELGLNVIMWSRDTIDWRDSDKKTLYKRATEDLEAGEIILMHPKAHTAEVLPDILKYIRERGLTASTVSRNIGE